MDEESKKRNTDCVYFLASPLTCKKGNECEFRHSDFARLNPRDCWYWLAGNCLNPTCGYRHPPLEGQPENILEPASLPHQASVPVIKCSVPCYFYFNGFCNKGDNCSYLHGPSSVPAGQFSKAASTVTNVHHSENKTLVSNEGMPAPIEPPRNQMETSTKAGESIQFQSKVEGQRTDSNYVLQQSPSSQNSLPECDEAVVRSEIRLPAERFRSPLGVDPSSPCTDQSSEDQFDGQIVPEERWESSPGFDVLVDDGSEKLGYEDDPEYLLAHKRDDRVLHEHLLQYDYEDAIGYDSLDYPELGILYEHGVYGAYDHPDDDHISDHVRRVPKRSREKMRNPMVQQKRQHLSREVDFNDRNDSDLRNHLRKRRRINGLPKRSSLPHPNDRGQERPGRRHNCQPLQGRLTSDVGSDRVGGYSENDSHQWGQARQSQPRHSKSRQQERERRRQARPKFVFSEVSRGDMAQRDARPPQVSSTTFTGPKTLAQIKDEKRKARENSDGFRSTTRNEETTLQNFEGPKPLSEILKDKRRLGSTSDDNTSSRSRHDQSESEMNYVGFDKDDDLLDEYEDNDESLAV